MLFIGTAIGRVVANTTGVPIVVALACGLVSMPAAFTPIPLGLVFLSMSTYNLAARGVIPVTVCVCLAHLLFVGIGVPQKLMSGKAKKTDDASGEDTVARSTV